VSEAAAGQGFKALHGWMHEGKILSCVEGVCGISIMYVARVEVLFMPARCKTLIGLSGPVSVIFHGCVVLCYVMRC